MVKMKTSAAFAPCHITGLFQIFDKPANPLYAGSKGAGFSISKGVKTTVKAVKAAKWSFKIKVNGSNVDSAEVSEKVLNIFRSMFPEIGEHEVLVEHEVEAPIGAGFGTSGAAALSLALALNDAFNLGMSKIKAAQLAHTAEVECKTGLGTVIAETFGGVEIRIKPGAPGIGEIKQIPVSKDYVAACLNFGSLSTKEFLTDTNVRGRINEFGGKLLDKLAEEPNVTNLMTFSRRFAEHVGLITKKVRKVLNEADSESFICSMPMFGESAFTLVERESLERLLKTFRKHGSDGQIMVSEIDFEGARLLK